ncbi:MAG: indolepyruvate oxidoreductase subunit beta family protein [Rhodocyclaceae bacterium]|nr:MAG: indolepyruvate oxidoreductase subunit beta family protein [Rhodocyclaceae bacterium]
MSAPPAVLARPFTILVAALGGEGGGVLADWIVDAALHEGFPVQSTSIPGVSQRTGATTYYLELYPQRPAQPQVKQPVMALLPSPGAVDLMAASELVEAGRAMQNAFVTADRTTLVASSHRIYATSEKVVPSDGRYASEKIISAAPQLARRAILFDMSRLAQEAGTVINAVLFGAMAGSGALPLTRAACEAAIRGAGKGAEASLRGFALGFAHASGETVPAAPLVARPPDHAAPNVGAAPQVERVAREFPVAMHQLLNEAVRRLDDYQDAVYAGQYLDRVRPLLAVERELGGADPAYPLACAAARLLVLWMTYEDVIRVAELKTRAGRYSRLRAEAGALSGQPLVVVDYLKPGAEEIADILPDSLAARLRRWAAQRRARGRPTDFGLRLHSSSVSGYLALRLLVLFKPWRRKSARFNTEQDAIDRWLGAIHRFGLASLDRELVSEIIQCAALLRGYGDTQRRGRKVFEEVFETMLENESAAIKGLDRLKTAIRTLRNAALADPDAPPAARALAGSGGKPVIWLKAG